MSWLVGLKSPDFVVKSLYAEVDALPLMSSPLPMALITIGYLFFVLKFGPALMKNRKPYKLKNILIVYNVFQVVLSMYIFYTAAKYLSTYGLIHSKCFASDNDMRKQSFAAIWLYFIAKITEFFDTIFFILRKKSRQVSFLHVYHHTLMMVGTWCFLKWTPHDNALFTGLLNSLVHVFMYTYYAMAAVPSWSKYLWWKKYITVMQLVQFTMIFSHYVQSMLFTDCPPPRALAAAYTCNNLLFMYLFTKFYIDNYKKNGALEARKDKSALNGSLKKRTIKAE